MPTRHLPRGLPIPLLLASVMIGLACIGLLTASFNVSPTLVRSIPIPLGMSPNAVAVDSATGRAFITGDRAAVNVIATPTGRILTTTLLDEAPSAPVVDQRDGRVYVTMFNDPVASSPGGGVAVMLDAKSGQLLRLIQLSAQPSGQPSTMAVDERSGRVFIVGFNDVRVGGNSVTMLEGKSGRLLRTVRLPLEPQSLAIDPRANRVFVEGNSDTGPNGSGGLSLLDATSGRMLRTVALGPVFMAPVVDTLNGRVFVVDSNRYSERIRMLDAGSGRILWTTPVPGKTSIGAIALAAGNRRVFVSEITTLGLIHMLDAVTGRLLRTLPGRSWSANPVIAVSGEHVFLSTVPNVVSMIDARTGTVLRTTTMGPASATIAGMVVDGPLHRVFVLTKGSFNKAGQALGYDQIAVLDARSGAVVHLLPAGADPLGLGADERAGRVFVLNTVATVRTTDTWGWLPSWLRQRIAILPPAPPPLRTVPGSVSIIDASR